MSGSCTLRPTQSRQQSAPVRCEEVLTYAPSELLAQLGLGEAGIPGEEKVDQEILELRETPELFDKPAKALGPSDLSWNNGRLASWWNMDHRAVVTTPNAKWMPEYPVTMPGQVATRTDGRWGPQEYSFWPQVYDTAVAHHACIPVEDGRVKGVCPGPELFKAIDERMWAPDKTCGVLDLGFLDQEFRARLFAAVQQPRLGLSSYIAREVLLVRGSFMANASHAQELFHVGVPVWFIQPLTKLVHIVEVIIPELICNKLDVKLSYPRIDTALKGLASNPGRWALKMQEEMLKSLLDNELPRLLVPVPEPTPAPPTKRARLADPGRRDKQPPRPVTSSSKTPKTHHGTRAPSKAEATQPQFLKYTPPSAADVPEVWVDALTAAGTLPHNETAAVYFWPPPFLLDLDNGKGSCFRHNYLQIRRFCRQRLVDKQVHAQPLTVAEWRAALWGDYNVDPEPARSDLNMCSKERAKARQAIKALFGSTGGLPSYDDSVVVRWGERELTLKDVDVPELCAQISWEAHRINWRCEFIELDCELTSSRRSTTYAHWERESQVCRVWSPLGSGLRVFPRWEQNEPNTVSWV
ncbi:hypothetical protein C8Q72DRAFT_791953 [Fomitopsis betulina]|nr:hypothetical protein C8Q72DRAFT_791953 [Fomitopsis betulina]